MGKWRYIKKYAVAKLYEITEYSAMGYEPVGGVAFTSDDEPYQAMALYDDEVTLNPKEEALNG